MSVIPKIDLPPDFTKGLQTALGMGVGGAILRVADPVIREQADNADKYLNSFPVEKKDVEGREVVVLSTPESIVLWGGIGAGVLVSAPAVIFGAAVTTTAMKVRRMYVNNECSLM